MSRLALGGIGIGDNYTNYNSQFELTPSDGIGYTFTTAITSIVRFIFNLILVLPLKFFIGSHTDMSMETPLAELPGYISHIPHPKLFQREITEIKNQS